MFTEDFSDGGEEFGFGMVWDDVEVGVAGDHRREG